MESDNQNVVGEVVVEVPFVRETDNETSIHIGNMEQLILQARAAEEGSWCTLF